MPDWSATKPTGKAADGDAWWLPPSHNGRVLLSPQAHQEYVFPACKSTGKEVFFSVVIGLLEKETHVIRRPLLAKTAVHQLKARGIGPVVVFVAL